MKSVDIILKELKLTLRDEGVSPLPADEYLSERIGQRLKRFKTSQADKEKSDKEKSDKELDNFNSPVCYASSDEVQSDYRIGTASFSQIDTYIDQLISKNSTCF